LRGAGQNVVPPRHHEQLLDHALDGGIRGVEGLDTVAVIRGDLGLGVGDHHDRGAEGGQQENSHQRDDQRRAFLCGETSAESVHHRRFTASD
jgi:hypothetical protein